MSIKGNQKISTITLTPVEMMIAGQVGTMRRVKSRNQGYNAGKHTYKSDWNTDFDGACSEIALAKYLNIYWDGSVNSFKRADVGQYQVRSTPRLDGRLIIRENDNNPDEIFVFITTGNLPTLHIIGSILCKEAKCDKFKHEDCWWIPQNELYQNLKGCHEQISL